MVFASASSETGFVLFAIGIEGFRSKCACTNGEEVLRFRRPLFQAAHNAASAVAPFCLNYKKIDDHKVAGHNRDTICWYGDMDFISHFWTLAGHNCIQVELSWLERQFDHITKDISTEMMAATAHTAVHAAYIPIPRPRPPILAASFSRSAAI